MNASIWFYFVKHFYTAEVTYRIAQSIKVSEGNLSVCKRTSDEVTSWIHQELIMKTVCSFKAHYETLLISLGNFTLVSYDGKKEVNK